MDADIDFGELEESAPQVQLRPDRNKHYAVAEVGDVDGDELPIFVDMDVMWDMEEHALTDTTVELGGVMLGGQFEDDEGKPFVLISDSLRAKHYESTKGSFKFTHDTWSEITRQREEFPDDLQMVGWYHTHPDWGVFLSGMDMFICDNFFNRMLDVALVIDPCRDDRGMYQWTGVPESRIRRTRGFYVISSRFRQAELELFAAQLEGNEVMIDPRMRSVGGGGVGAAPVVNIADRNPWQGVAVLGMLSMQFVVLILIAAKLLLPSFGIGGGDDRVADLEKRFAELRMADEREIKAQAQAKVLDRVLSELKGEPKGQFTALVDTQAEAEHWKASAAGQLALQREMTEALKQQDAQLKKAKARENSLEKRLTKRIDDLRDSNAKLKTQLAKYKDDDKEEDGEATKILGFDLWLVVTVGIVLLALVVLGVVSSMNPRRDFEYPEPERERRGEREQFDEPGDDEEPTNGSRD